MVGQFAEKRDPSLACVAYKRGQCDDALVACTNKHAMFKLQARYIVERQDVELWAKVLSADAKHRRQLIDQARMVAAAAIQLLYAQMKYPCGWCCCIATNRSPPLLDDCPSLPPALACRLSALRCPSARTQSRYRWRSRPSCRRTCRQSLLSYWRRLCSITAASATTTTSRQDGGDLWCRVGDICCGSHVCATLQPCRDSLCPHCAPLAVLVQNLLIITAIKADKTRVKDYIHRLDNFDGPAVGEIAVG